MCCLFLKQIYLKTRPLLKNFDFYYYKMSFRKNAIVTGSIFFVLRLVFCTLLVVYLNRDDANKFEIDWKGTLCATAFGIGAFTDLFLILGAWKKNACAIYVWCIAQFFLVIGNFLLVGGGGQDRPCVISGLFFCKAGMVFISFLAMGNEVMNSIGGVGGKLSHK